MTDISCLKQYFAQKSCRPVVWDAAQNALLADNTCLHSHRLKQVWFHRLDNPIEDAAVMKVGSLYGISNLLEQVAKARKRVAGAMFPRHVK